MFKSNIFICLGRNSRIINNNLVINAYSFKNNQTTQLYNLQTNQFQLNFHQSSCTYGIFDKIGSFFKPEEKKEKQEPPKRDETIIEQKNKTNTNKQNTAETKDTELTEEQKKMQKEYENFEQELFDSASLDFDKFEKLWDYLGKISPMGKDESTSERTQMTETFKKIFEALTPEQRANPSKVLSPRARQRGSLEELRRLAVCTKQELYQFIGVYLSYSGTVTEVSKKQKQTGKKLPKDEIFGIQQRVMKQSAAEFSKAEKKFNKVATSL